MTSFVKHNCLVMHFLFIKGVLW